jgi:uncharacterized membrane protein YdfJ with MMPL/SSD domain
VCGRAASNSPSLPSSRAGAGGRCSRIRRATASPSTHARRRELTEKLARVSSRRPWLVVGLWLLVILAAFALVATFLAFEGEAEITRTTESKQADEILDEGFPQEAGRTEQAITEVVVVRAEDGEVGSAATRTRVAALAEELRTAGATRVVTYG